MDKEGVIKREDVVLYVNTSDTGTPEYNLANKGILSASGSLNPENEEYQYIADKRKTTVTKSLNPVMAVDAHRYNGDVVNDYFYGIGEQQQINKVVKIVRVDLAKPTTGTAANAQLFAYKIGITDFDSGTGGEPLGFALELTQEGDFVNGTFDLSTKAFTPED